MLSLAAMQDGMFILALFISLLTIVNTKAPTPSQIRQQQVCQLIYNFESYIIQGKGCSKILKFSSQFQFLVAKC